MPTDKTVCEYAGNDDYQRKISLKGGQASACLRAERAKEPVRKVYDCGDGTKIKVHDSFAEHRRGIYCTLVPLDLVELYPIVMGEFDFVAGTGGADVIGEEFGIRVEGALKDFKHQVLRAAKVASGAAAGEVQGHGIVVLPAEFEALGFTFDFRLLYWTGILDERLEAKRADRNRVVCGGASDIEAIASDENIDESSCVKRLSDGSAACVAACLDGNYAVIELRQTIDELLEQFDEVDQYIFRQHFLEGRDYQDIAAELGKANSSITYAMKRVLPILRQDLRDLGYRR